MLRSVDDDFAPNDELDGGALCLNCTCTGCDRAVEMDRIDGLRATSKEAHNSAYLNFSRDPVSWAENGCG